MNGSLQTKPDLPSRENVGAVQWVASDRAPGRTGVTPQPKTQERCYWLMRSVAVPQGDFMCRSVALVHHSAAC